MKRYLAFLFNSYYPSGGNDGKLYEDGELIGDIIEMLDDTMAVNSCSEKYGKNKIVFFKRIDMNL